MKSPAIVLCFSALLSFSANATTYYISPTGNNGAPGTTASAPLGTFAFAVPKLQPGDNLVLLDGAYDETNSGFLVMANVHGTSSQPITIKAQNERKAHIHNKGGVSSINISASSYVTFDGLQLSSQDNASAPGDGQGMQITNCDHLVLRRLLVHHNNRYGNNHLITCIGLTNSLFEESEFYYHHRHCILLKPGNHNTFRRLYFNSRGYGTIPGGADNGYGPIGGDAGVALYPAHDCIIENCIAEGYTGCLVAIPAVDTADNNRILGGAINNPLLGLNFYARSEVPATAYTAQSMPKNNVVENFVSLDATLDGARFVSVKGQHISNATILGSTENGVNVTYSGDATAGLDGDGIYSFLAENILSANNGMWGFSVNGIQTWSADHVNSFGNKDNYWPTSSSNFIAPTSTNPNLGTCKMWIPDGSPMKGAGKNGADIGANILYRYQDGVLTNQPLWDPATGEFSHGAVIPEINGIPGQSLFDVNKRLNVNCNSCPFPASYPKPGTSAITPTRMASSPEQAFLSITPNYAGSSISVKTDANQSAMVEIYNLQGKRVGQIKSVQGSSIQWQRGGNLPAGMYFVKASSRGITATAKILLDR